MSPVTAFNHQRLADWLGYPRALLFTSGFAANQAVVVGDNLRTLRLAELYRVLPPGDTLVLSTLAELEQEWGQVDGGVHINGFLSEAAIAEAFAPYRHRLLAEPHHLHYPRLTDLLREIKGGAGYLHGGRAPGLTSRGRLRALEACWPQQPAGLPLSYRVVYGVLYRD